MKFSSVPGLSTPRWRSRCQRGYGPRRHAVDDEAVIADFYQKASGIRQTLILAGAKEETASIREPDISRPLWSTHSDMARINIAFRTYSAVRIRMISQILRYLVSLECENYAFLQVFSPFFDDSALARQEGIN